MRESDRAGNKGIKLNREEIERERDHGRERGSNKSADFFAR